jgi:predicted NBD/HSP70 family sugar kinase
MASKIGVDFGGSWLRVGVIDPDSGQARDIQRYPSPGDWSALTDILRSWNKSDITGFGIAVAATLGDHAVVLNAPNLSWLNGRNLRADLERLLGKKVVISNDMEAATEGELARGVLRQYRWAIFDTISTGWGGNLVLDGRRVDGEPGHVNVSFDPAFPCGCGALGCNEARFSGSAMERRIRDYIDVLQLEPAPDQGPWQVLGAAAEAEAPWALTLLDEWAEGVGRAWANVLNRIRQLEAIVYMGTTAESLLALPRVERRLRATLQRICMFPEHQADRFPIVPGTEPERAIHGAVILHDRLA